jgi:hypothetical protein
MPRRAVRPRVRLVLRLEPVVVPAAHLVLEQVDVVRAVVAALAATCNK